AGRRQKGREGGRRESLAARRGDGTHRAGEGGRPRGGGGRSGACDRRRRANRDRHRRGGPPRPRRAEAARRKGDQVASGRGGRSRGETWQAERAHLGGLLPLPEPPRLGRGPTPGGGLSPVSSGGGTNRGPSALSAACG